MPNTRLRIPGPTWRLLATICLPFAALLLVEQLREWLSIRGPLAYLVHGHVVLLGALLLALPSTRTSIARMFFRAAVAGGVTTALILAVAVALDDSRGISGSRLAATVAATLTAAVTEEVTFRHVTPQLFAALSLRTPVSWLSLAVLSSAAFAIAHVPADSRSVGQPGSEELSRLFLNRFLFGMIASALVWLTGSLSASTVLHVTLNAPLLLRISGLQQPLALLDIGIPAASAAILLAGLALGIRRREHTRPRITAPSAQHTRRTIHASETPR